MFPGISSHLFVRRLCRNVTFLKWLSEHEVYRGAFTHVSGWARSSLLHIRVYLAVCIHRGATTLEISKEICTEIHYEYFTDRNIYQLLQTVIYHVYIVVIWHQFFQSLEYTFTANISLKCIQFWNSIRKCIQFWNSIRRFMLISLTVNTRLLYCSSIVYLKLLYRNGDVIESKGEVILADVILQKAMSIGLQITYNQVTPGDAMRL